MKIRGPSFSCWQIHANFQFSLWIQLPSTPPRSGSQSKCEIPRTQKPLVSCFKSARLVLFDLWKLSLCTLSETLTWLLTMKNSKITCPWVQPLRFAADSFPAVAASLGLETLHPSWNQASALTGAISGQDTASLWGSSSRWVSEHWKFVFTFCSYRLREDFREMS
jgi:hypothetical protein